MKYCPKCETSFAASQTICQHDGEALVLKDLYGMTGRVINDKYRIGSLMSIGGMSAIYRAEQLGVERQVAFKVLLPNLAVNNNMMRTLFEREARTAGLLMHENIATVHDSGHTSDDLAYLVMEWLDGQTLERELRQEGQLNYARCARLLNQIAAALDAAHAQGIIHRDLKPSNVMLVPRPDGRDTVKVLDFGLAKVATEASDMQVSSALGTPHYASPEQFRIGEEISGQSDIYSLGVLLYRMLTGRLPFDAGSIHELVRLHLLETPPPLRELRPDTPLEVENLVNRLLAKTPQYRPATAAAAAEEFERAVRNHFGTLPTEAPQTNFTSTHVSPGSAPSASLSSSGPRSAKQTSAAQRSLPPPPARGISQTASSATFVSTTGSAGAVTSGVAAQTSASNATAPAASRFTTAMLVNTTRPKNYKPWLTTAAVVFLAGMAGVYFYLSSRPKLSAKDTIMLADFDNTTGEEVFDQTLKQALAVQLAQSPFLNMLGDDKVRETLHFMNRKPEEKITRAIAREIAQRRGLKAIFAGQIDKLDRHYALTLEALNTETGASLSRVFFEAESKDQVIKTLGQAALKLREQLGESLASTTKFNAPIENATTSSLEALQAYTQGYQQLNFKANLREAIPLYQRAIELDPNFAMPHYQLAMIYTTLGQPRLSIEHSTKAFNLRERTSERERLTITALYYSLVTGETEKAVETYKLMAQSYPNSALPHSGLAGVYRQTGQLPLAVTEAETALKLDPNEVAPHLLRATALMRLNRLDEANQKLTESQAQKIDGLGLRAALFQCAWLQDDQALLQQQINWARENQHPDKALDWQAQRAAAGGRLKEATGLWRQAMDAVKQRGQKELGAPYALAAGLSLALAGQTSEGQRWLDEANALARDNFTHYSVLSTAPFGPLTYALAGASDKAQSLGDEVARNQPQNTLANQVWLPITKAILANRQGNYEQALELLKHQAQYEGSSSNYSNWARGEALLKMRRGYEAEIEFKRIIGNHGLEAASLLYPLAHLATARARAFIGDTEESRLYYKKFLEQWKDADANLPIVVAAKNELVALKKAETSAHSEQLDQQLRAERRSWFAALTGVFRRSVPARTSAL
ncbi:MAG: protein kinase [Acidobacteria bacterium]|nr:protein kinase [Acidobacteriota bacterium]MBI3425215.1 protein kinase [Acidobacteriota bacterium]